MSGLLELTGAQVRACRACSERFAATPTAHSPRPVFWCDSRATILVAGQAPGTRVHASGKFFDDPSGDRLRQWMGIDRQAFYDRSTIAILPMAFCFPGLDSKGSDLPPPRVCADLWRERILALLPNIRTTILLGGHAQRWHLGKQAAGGVRNTVARWAEFAPLYFPLPHPSWRNNALIAGVPGFESQMLPALRKRVAELIRDNPAAINNPACGRLD